MCFFDDFDVLFYCVQLEAVDLCSSIIVSTH